MCDYTNLCWFNHHTVDGYQGTLPIVASGFKSSNLQGQRSDWHFHRNFPITSCTTGNSCGNGRCMGSLWNLGPITMGSWMNFHQRRVKLHTQLWSIHCIFGRVVARWKLPIKNLPVFLSSSGKPFFRLPVTSYRKGVEPPDSESGWNPLVQWYNLLLGVSKHVRWVPPCAPGMTTLLGPWVERTKQF